MKRVGLDPQSKKWTSRYSLGMKQRLAIAQAIMENPDLIILDEPMNGLDEEGTAEIRKLFLELKEKGKLIIVASHNREDISVLCDEVYEIKAKKSAVPLTEVEIRNKMQTCSNSEKEISVCADGDYASGHNRIRFQRGIFLKKTKKYLKI